MKKLGSFRRINYILHGDEDRPLVGVRFLDHGRFNPVIPDAEIQPLRNLTFRNLLGSNLISDIGTFMRIRTREISSLQDQQEGCRPTGKRF
jgi:hypothetical protein